MVDDVGGSGHGGSAMSKREIELSIGTSKDWNRKETGGGRNG